MSNGNTGRMTLRVEVEQWPLLKPFRITGSTMVNADVVVTTIERNGRIGRGEATGVDYLNDDVPHMLKQIEAARASIEAGISRQALRELMPVGGARNALDCALWELEARQTGRTVWQIAGLDNPRPLLTTYTLGAEEPSVMAAGAREFSTAKALKLKLTGAPSDAERVRAVRAVRPDVWMGVDANQGFSLQHFQALLPVLIEARVALIEQPFRVGSEPTLQELRSPIPVAADESAQGLANLPKLVGRFNMVNIKLDKCGGLTEALLIAREARRLGLETMVGNMVGTSLAMAPAFVVGQLCRVVDLDGPLLLKTDRSPAATYERGCIECAPQVWGGSAA